MCLNNTNWNVQYSTWCLALDYMDHIQCSFSTRIRVCLLISSLVMHVSGDYRLRRKWIKRKSSCHFSNALWYFKNEMYKQKKTMANTDVWVFDKCLHWHTTEQNKPTSHVSQLWKLLEQGSLGSLCLGWCGRQGAQINLLAFQRLKELPYYAGTPQCVTSFLRC